MSKKDMFVRRMEYWCSVANLGYDQWQRWDIFDGGETDCSALVYYCLWEAGFFDEKPTWGNTATLWNHLKNRGWVRLEPDGRPQKGHILLNDEKHVGVWTGYGVAQASIDENGNIAGGQAGDQTGRETNVTIGYYNYPWDCYLRYVGEDADPEKPKIRYRLKTEEDGWLDWMENLHDTGGSGDDYAGVEGHAAIDIEFANLKGWYDVERNREGKLSSITVYYETDTSETGGKYYKAVYRAHCMGAWSGWCNDDEEHGTDIAPIDMLQIKLEEA